MANPIDNFLITLQNTAGLIKSVVVLLCTEKVNRKKVNEWQNADRTVTD